MSDDEGEPATQISDFETQFVPQEDDDDTLWEVIEITAEQGKRYRVKWAGTDPSTGKPWAESWVPKHDCTDDLVEEWKRKKARRRKRGGDTSKAKTGTARRSAASKASKRGSTTSTTPKRTIRTLDVTPLSSEDEPATQPNKRKHSSLAKRTSHLVNDDVDDFEPSHPRKRRKVQQESEVEFADGTPVVKRRVHDKAIEEGNDQDVWMTDYSNEPGRPARSKKGKERATDISVDIPAVTKFGPPRGAKKKQVDKGETAAAKAASTSAVPDPGRDSASQTESEDEPPPPKKRITKAVNVSKDRNSASKGKGKAREIDRIALREEEEEESQVISQVVLTSKTPTPPTRNDPPPQSPACDTDFAPTEDHLGISLDNQKPSRPSSEVEESNSPAAKSSNRTAPRDSFDVVPETQSTPRNRLVTPPNQATRVYGRHPHSPYSPRSVKKVPGVRPLKPIPAMTPSNFRTVLNKARREEEEGGEEDESIDQFSSPEKGRSRETISSQLSLDFLKRKSLPLSSSQNPNSTLAGRMKRKRRLSDIIASSSAQAGQAVPRQMDGDDHQTIFEEMESAYVDYSSGVVANADPDSVQNQFDGTLSEPEGPDDSQRGEVLKNGVVSQMLDDNVEEVPPTLSTRADSSVINSQSQEPSQSSSNGDLREQLNLAVQLLHKKSEEISRLESDLYSAKRETESLKKGETLKIESAKRQLTEAHAELLETWRLEADKKDREAREREAALQRELTEWKAKAEEAVEREQKWLRVKGDLESQRDLFQEQYRKASDYVSGMSTENHELQSRVELLEGQLKTGVEAVRVMYQVRVEKLQVELHRYEARVRLLEETQRRMGSEEVVKKAAEWEERVADVEKLRARTKALWKDREELRGEVATWRREKEVLEEKVRELEKVRDAKDSQGEGEKQGEVEGEKMEIGMVDGEEWDEDEDGDWVPEDDDDGTESSSEVSEEVNEEDEDGEQAEEVEEVEVKVETSQNVDEACNSGEDLVYMCKWAVDGATQRCDALLENPEELLQHFTTAGHWSAVL